MGRKKNLAIFLVFILLIALVGCGPAKQESKTATDYADANNWMSLPAADDKKVDVFYLYPTAWKKVGSDAPNVCGIDDPSMRKGARAAFERQATAFETVGNIYAPFYRQFDAEYFLTSSLKKQAVISGGIPKTDAVAAFDYYIKHYNNGRPFILAGHSQGSIMLKYILSEYMKNNPAVYKRMIAGLCDRLFRDKRVYGRKSAPEICGRPGRYGRHHLLQYRSP